MMENGYFTRLTSIAHERPLYKCMSPAVYRKEPDANGDKHTHQHALVIQLWLLSLIVQRQQ